MYNDDITEDNLLNCQVASNVDFDIFAEHFAAQITNDSRELEGIYGNVDIENRFPQGNQLFEDMILSVCEGGN
ncbi:MAG: hypothetical protein IJX85_10080 [Lachnospiraceae bacterium]|nr:hypothetical protein [Lachnospiraceae bacterium]